MRDTRNASNTTKKTKIPRLGEKIGVDGDVVDGVVASVVVDGVGVVGVGVVVGASVT